MANAVLDEAIAGLEMDLLLVIKLEPYLTFDNVDEVYCGCCVKARLVSFHVSGAAGKLLFQLLHG